jgi:ribose transport system substrate-binding protein
MTRSKSVRYGIGAAAALATIIVAAVALAGSASGAHKRTSANIPFNKLSFTFGSADDAVGIFKTVGDGMVSDGTKLGMKITRFDNNLDGPTALRNAGLMVQDKPTVAIDWNTVVGVGNAVGATFTRAHIPCLAVNQQIKGCHWFNLSNEAMGLGAAHVIDPVAKSRGWNGHNTTIIMVIAAANGREVNNGPRYFYVSTAKALPYFKKVSPASIGPQTTTIGGKNGIQIDCKSTIDGAYAAAKNIIPEIPKGNNILLYGSDDDCGQGAYNALKQAGFGNRILTGGLGAAPNGMQELRTDPNWIVEGALFLEDWAPYILSEAVAIANGAHTPPLTAAPQVMLTKSNVNDYYNGNTVKKLPPLVKNNQYLAKYGILQKFGKIKGLNTK